MKHQITTEYINNLYETIVRPNNNNFSENLAKSKKQVIFVFLGYFLFNFFADNILHFFNAPNSLVFFLNSIIKFGGFMVLALYFKKTLLKRPRQTTLNFKETMLPKIFETFDPTLKYFSKEGISEETFKESRFYPNLEQFYSEDLFKGKFGKIEYEFSEVSIFGNEQQGPGSAIYRGLFYVANFNKNISGYTSLEIDFAEKLFGSNLGSGMQKALENPNDKNEIKVCKLENVIFEKEFIVKTNNQIEARTIFTPIIMEQFLELRKKINYQFRVAFTNGKIYFAIQTNKDMFEDFNSTDEVNKSRLKEWLTLLDFFMHLIEELHLDQDLYKAV